MRGGTLDDELAEADDGKLSETDGKLVGRCILRGLRDMHAGGYAHLDIKPRNIGLAEEGCLDDAALMDFGSVEPLGAATAPAPSLLPGMQSMQKTSALVLSAECSVLVDLAATLLLPWRTFSCSDNRAVPKSFDPGSEVLV